MPSSEVAALFAELGLNYELDTLAAAIDRLAEQGADCESRGNR